MNDLERDIRENVISRRLWLSPTEVSAEVRGGEVVLAGTVDKEDDVELLVKQVGRVPGVVSVTSSLTVRETAGKRQRFSRLAP